MDNEEFDNVLRGKNINFLIGSGASVPMYSTLNLSKPYSFEELVSHRYLSENAKQYIYLYYFKHWIFEMSMDPKEYMKSLFGNEKTQKKKVTENYRRFIGALCQFLQCESNEKPKRINIFTTNYDLLFEYSFDEFLEKTPLIYFNDGSRGFFRKYINNNNFYLNVSHSGYNDNFKREVPTINLFKMHGSLSWRFDNNKIQVSDQNSTVREAKGLLEIIEKNNYEVKKSILEMLEDDIDKTVKKFNEFVLENEELLIKPLNEFYEKYKNIPIINPDKYKFNKTVSEQYYYQLIRDFSYELEKEETVLIVFGFSFADEHIQSIFERSLINPKLFVIIISYSEEQQDKLKSKFGQYRNVKFLPDFDMKNAKWTDDIKGDFNYLLELLGDIDE